MDSITEQVPMWLLTAVGGLVIGLLILIALVLRRRRNDGVRQLREGIAAVSYEALHEIIIPGADDGDIQLEHVILTENGIAVVETRIVDGVVFGSDRMQDWTVIAGDRRFTFANPQHRLYDCVAALRQIIPDAPISGHILFSDAAQFTKGVPSDVAVLRDWLKQFAKVNRKKVPPRVEMLRKDWATLRECAVESQMRRLIR